MKRYRFVNFGEPGAAHTSEHQDGEWVRHDEAAARIAELEKHRLAVAQAVGIVYEGDGFAPVAGPDSEVLGEIERVRRDSARVAELEARLDELEVEAAMARKIIDGCSAERKGER